MIRPANDTSVSPRTRKKSPKTGKANYNRANLTRKFDLPRSPTSSIRIWRSLAALPGISPFVCSRPDSAARSHLLQGRRLAAANVMGDYSGPSYNGWDNGGQILDGFGDGLSYDFGGNLFDALGSNDTLNSQMGYGDLEYLDLDNVDDHLNVATAVYQPEDSGSAGHLSWPVSVSYTAPESFLSPSANMTVPSTSKVSRPPTTNSQFDHYEQSIDETSDIFSSVGASVQDETSQQEKTYGHDPLDGLDDFRALLEAAEADEMLHTGRSTSGKKGAGEHLKGKKRSRQSAVAVKSKLPPPERKRSKMKDHELARYLDENFTTMNDGMGVVPKYRAKNRLRSIIKRKPGTQDTDLMSSNVEILGGRVDKQTLAWLRENFEEQPGQIMRREFLYERYLEFCQLTGREAMNAACVGKVVRTVFQGLSTRRLGRRGGSKYHYVNLQVVENSPFAAMRQSLGNAQKTGRKTKKQKTSTSWVDNVKIQDDTSTVEEASMSVSMASARVWAKNQKKLEAVELDFVTSGLSDEERSRRNILQLVTNCLSEVQVNIDELKIVPADLAKEALWRSHIPIHSVVSDYISLRDIVRFLGYLRIHIGMLGGLMIRLNFHCIPEIITNFWQHQQPSLQVPQEADVFKFRKILENFYIQDFLRRVMYEFMDNVVTFFLPSKYAQVPDHLRAVLRDVAVKFDRWMVAATDGLPAKAREILISSAFAFCRVVEALLDLSSNVENLSLLERQKSTRPAVMAAFENVVVNGCLMTTNTSTTDRTAAQTCLMKLLSLPDGRNMAGEWDAWLTDFLQQSVAAVAIDGTDCFDLKAAQLKALDSFVVAWSRLMLELEGAVRFPVFGGGGPCYGVIRFLRDSVGFAVDCEKARLRGQTLIALNAEAIVESVTDLIGNSSVFRCDYTLEHYIQCGIPLPLVTSQSADFFTAIPEVAAILQQRQCVEGGDSTDSGMMDGSSSEASLFVPAVPRRLASLERAAVSPSGVMVEAVASLLQLQPKTKRYAEKTKRAPRRTVAPRIKFV